MVPLSAERAKQLSQPGMEIWDCEALWATPYVSEAASEGEFASQPLTPTIRR
jgi:hypothetical protein